jgi:SagB-type dehydrogenase family enzyme
MTSFLSKLHKELRSRRLNQLATGEDVLHTVPEERHKTYPRMNRLSLPSPVSLENSLSEVLNKRRSFTSSSTGALTIQEWGTLLGTSLRKHQDSTKRNYPSGGALYPIETYLVIPKFADAGESGVFHYHPTAHALEHLWGLPLDFSVEKLIPNAGGLSAASVLLFTSVWGRSSKKYGDFSYLLALLETGHMSENVLLTATALDLGSRPFAGFDDALAARLLDIDEAFEQSVLAIAIGQETVSSPDSMQ